MKTGRLAFSVVTALAVSQSLSVWVVSAGRSKSLVDRAHVQIGDITTVAGGHIVRGAVSPRSIAFFGICGVAVNRTTGDIYLSDSIRHTIFKIDAQGQHLRPFAGIQVAGFNGDGKPALQTALHVPTDIAVDQHTGDVYVADSHNYRIRAISADGSSVRTVAGIGIRGIPPEETPTEFPLVGPIGRRNVPVFSGDGGPAKDAEVNQPSGVALDARSNVYIADAANQRIRVVNTQPNVIKVAGVTIKPGAIETIAGTGEVGFSGDGGPALSAKLDCPRRVKITPQGDILVVDFLNHRLRKIDRSSGAITTLAEGARQLGEEYFPVGWSIDGADVGPEGEIYYSDLKAHTVTRIDARTGSRTLVAGTERTPGLASDGVAATKARLNGAGALALAPDGQVILADLWNNLLWRIRNGTMHVLAGGGSAGEGVSALQASFSVLGPIAVNDLGDVYVTDMFNHRIRMIKASTGVISTFAGTGYPGYSGDGGPPQRATMITPLQLSFIDGDLYFSDPQIPVIRRSVQGPKGIYLQTLIGDACTDPTTTTTASSTTTTVAMDKSEMKSEMKPEMKPEMMGMPMLPNYGDGHPAREAQLVSPQMVAKNPKTGELYIADSWLSTIRKIDQRGIITTIAGTGEAGYSGDHGPGLKAQFNWPITLAFDKNANLYVSELFSHVIRKIAPDGTVTTYAGTGRKGYGGDGGPADQAEFNMPSSIAIDSEGNIYVADSGNNVVRKIEAAVPHRITTVAGTGKPGFSGDGGRATAAMLNTPRGVAIGPDGTLYITDSLNGRIRAVRLREPVLE